jgi:hypothetical protein
LLPAAAVIAVPDIGLIQCFVLENVARLGFGSIGCVPEPLPVPVAVEAAVVLAPGEPPP